MILDKSETKQNKYQTTIKNIIFQRHKTYNSNQNTWNNKLIRNIIFNEKSHLVSSFKDYLVYDDSFEFLKRYYFRNESQKRMPELILHYSNTLILPKYSCLSELKIMFRGLSKKIALHENMGKSKNNINTINVRTKNEKIFTQKLIEEINRIKPLESKSEISNPVINAKKKEFENNTKPKPKINFEIKGVNDANCKKVALKTYQKTINPNESLNYIQLKAILFSKSKLFSLTNLRKDSKTLYYKKNDNFQKIKKEFGIKAAKTNDSNQKLKKYFTKSPENNLMNITKHIKTKNKIINMEFNMKKSTDLNLAEVLNDSINFLENNKNTIKAIRRENTKFKTIASINDQNVNFSFENNLIKQNHNRGINKNSILNNSMTKKIFKLTSNIYKLVKISKNKIDSKNKICLRNSNIKKKPILRSDKIIEKFNLNSTNNHKIGKSPLLSFDLERNLFSNLFQNNRINFDKSKNKLNTNQISKYKIISKYFNKSNNHIKINMINYNETIIHKNKNETNKSIIKNKFCKILKSRYVQNKISRDTSKIQYKNTDLQNKLCKSINSKSSTKIYKDGIKNIKCKYADEDKEFKKIMVRKKSKLFYEINYSFSKSKICSCNDKYNNEIKKDNYNFKTITNLKDMIVNNKNFKEAKICKFNVYKNSRYTKI